MEKVHQATVRNSQWLCIESSFRCRGVKNKVFPSRCIMRCEDLEAVQSFLFTVIKLVPTFAMDLSSEKPSICFYRTVQTKTDFKHRIKNGAYARRNILFGQVFAKVALQFCTLSFASPIRKPFPNHSFFSDIL